MKLTSLSLLFAIVPLVAACTASTDDVASSSDSDLTTSPSAYSLPPSDATARAMILARYSNVDPGGVVPRGLLEDALEFFDVNRANFSNTNYLTVVDFSRFSGQDRFFVVNLTTGAVEAHKVAHGSGSDPGQSGYAKKFSNVDGSYESSLGFYITGSIYTGKHPNSVHLYGLSPSGSPNQMASSNAFPRAILVHPATYVSDTNTGAQGRSEGCFALDPSHETSVANRIANGSLIYAEIAPLHAPVDAPACTVPGLGAGMCVSTAACTAETGMQSTPGHCPGAADIECCTPKM